MSEDPSYCIYLGIGDHSTRFQPKIRVTGNTKYREWEMEMNAIAK